MDQLTSSHISDILEDVKFCARFGRSQRLCELLEYLLTKNLSEDWASLKQYSIAIDVFKRREDFDPTIDSIVRVELHRLRKALGEYNALAGRFKVHVPKGGYRVIVTSVNFPAIPKEKTEAEKVLAPVIRRRSKWGYPAIALLSLVLIAIVSSDRIDPANPSLTACSAVVPNITLTSEGQGARGLNDILDLSRSVVSQYSSVNIVSKRSKCENLTPRFHVLISLVQSDPGVQITLKAYHGKRANLIYFANLGVSRETADAALHADAVLHRDVIRALADMLKPYGSLPRYAASLSWADEDKREAYACQINMYDSYSDGTTTSYKNYLNCLEAAVQTGAGSLDTRGALATSYLQQYIGYYAQTVPNPLLSARAILEEVGEDWISSSEMVIAKIIYESERPDFRADRLRSVLWNADQHYADNSIVMLNAAVRTGFKLGDWEKAKAMSDRLKTIHSGRDSSVYLVDAAYALLFAENHKIIDICAKAYVEHSVLSNILVRSCAVKARDTHWQSKTEKRLDNLNIGLDGALAEIVTRREYDGLLTAELIKYSRK